MYEGRAGIWKFSSSMIGGVVAWTGGGVGGGSERGSGDDGGSCWLGVGGSACPVTGARVFIRGQRRSAFPGLSFHFPLGGISFVGIRCGSYNIPYSLSCRGCGCPLGVGGFVDQCSLGTFFAGKEGEESGEEEKKRFRGGGKGRDSCSPEI